MATGFPAGFPSDPTVFYAQQGAQFQQPQSPAPGYVAPEVVKPRHSDDDLWTALWIVGGGVAATVGLLAWVATKNAREHKELGEGIDFVQRGLDSYIETHADDHRKIAERQAAVDAFLERNIDRLWTHLGVPKDARRTMPAQIVQAPSAHATIYATPLSSAQTFALPSIEAPRSVVSMMPTAPMNLPIYAAEGVRPRSTRATLQGAQPRTTLQGVGAMLSVPSLPLSQVLDGAVALSAAPTIPRTALVEVPLEDVDGAFSQRVTEPIVTRRFSAVPSSLAVTLTSPPPPASTSRSSARPTLRRTRKG